MPENHNSFEVIGWTPEGAVRFLDQTMLPGQVVYREVDTIEGMVEAIKALRVRGAPLIGISAAMGLAAAARKRREAGGSTSREEDLEWLRQAALTLTDARPTAVNLKWAVDRLVKRASQTSPDEGGAGFDDALRQEAQAVWDEDQSMCRAIGEVGASLIRDGSTVMTHCNAGKLATGGIGTALGGIYAAVEQSRKLRVYSCEARPLRQGSRLTAWELTQSGVPCTVVVDSAAGSVMSNGGVDLVVVGADRIAANGDVANKIGTYNLALLAEAHGIPFYVAAPRSTFDLSIASGEDIPIELRSAEEIERAPLAEAHNPAFDVTPARLITSIITDAGLIEPPYPENIRKVLG